MAVLATHIDVLVLFPVFGGARSVVDEEDLAVTGLARELFYQEGRPLGLGSEELFGQTQDEQHLLGTQASGLALLQQRVQQSGLRSQSLHWEAEY